MKCLIYKQVKRHILIQDDISDIIVQFTQVREVIYCQYLSIIISYKANISIKSHQDT